MFSFQVPADVSSAGCAASNTATTRDSADARMRVFRAFIDISPDLFLRPLGKCTRRRVYAPPDVLGQQRLLAPIHPEMRGVRRLTDDGGQVQVRPERAPRGTRPCNGWRPCATFPRTF